jgi:hypothetical protein
VLSARRLAGGNRRSEDSGGRAMPKSHEDDVVVRLRTFKELDDQLDLELEQTFPASDALQITRDRPPALKNQRLRPVKRAKRRVRAG